MPIAMTPATAPRGVHEIADFMHAENAELIVTLHRTIDAQLAILRAGRTAATLWAQARDYADLSGWAQEAFALAEPLADAILGIESGDRNS